MGKAIANYHDLPGERVFSSTELTSIVYYSGWVRPGVSKRGGSETKDREKGMRSTCDQMEWKRDGREESVC